MLRPAYNSACPVSSESGGQAAVNLANELGKRGVAVNTVATFDPHSRSGHLTLKYNNVGNLFNYFQKNPDTRTFGVPTGDNPYRGSDISSSFIINSGMDFTGNLDVGHNNVVQHGLSLGRKDIENAIK